MTNPPTDTTGPWEQRAEAVLGLLGPYLSRQRWARHDTAGEVSLRLSDQLRAGEPEALWLVVEHGGDLYQMVVGLRPSQAALDLGDRDVLGTMGSEALGSWFVYDGMADPVIVKHLADLMGVKGVDDVLVRPVGAEQSNTSVVLGQRVILKLFRRLQPGPNPDVEVTTGLDRVGFNHLASPLGVWQRDGFDLAVAQEFLAGGSEGWALALTSLRDFYASDSDEPEAAGGNFAAEARRIGDMTARMHVALAEAFGTEAAGPQAWIDNLLDRLPDAGLEPDLARAASSEAAGLAGIGTVPAVRVHGDYHLGQVMRSDAGWFVLDFEGEPARPIAERRLAWPPAKDVAGMLRSFDYAAGAVLLEQDAANRAGLAGRARAWERSNRDAFLAGYLAVPEVGRLYPGGDARSEASRALLGFFELDKALYELGYERAHRPDWQGLPLGAITRMLAAAGGIAEPDG